MDYRIILNLLYDFDFKLGGYDNLARLLILIPHIQRLNIDRLIVSTFIADPEQLYLIGCTCMHILHLKSQGREGGAHPSPNNKVTRSNLYQVGSKLWKLLYTLEFDGRDSWRDFCLFEEIGRDPGPPPGSETVVTVSVEGCRCGRGREILSLWCDPCPSTPAASELMDVVLPRRAFLDPVNRETFINRGLGVLKIVRFSWKRAL